MKLLGLNINQIIYCKYQSFSRFNGLKIMLLIKCNLSNKIYIWKKTII